ncbi:MAG: Fic family protein [bacterium]
MGSPTASNSSARPGSGTLNIIDWCAGNGNPQPVWNERAGSVILTFYPRVEEEKKSRVRDQVGTKLEPSRDHVLLLRLLRKEKSTAELMAATGRSNRTKFRNQVLNPLIADGLVEMTLPDKPRSSNQKYRLTDAGRKFLEKQ